ncbi:MAG TPA: phosphoribosylaminoimidazolesuccinocarboxamide synthase, partial [Lacipirellulaceae bacterium]
FVLRVTILPAIVRIDAMTTTVTETKLSDLPVRRGKVRDIYDLGDTLLLVSTDRISAFDWVLPTGIPDKGRVLTQLSRFWFEFFKDVPNHMISCDVEDFNLPKGIDVEPLVGRSMLVRKTSVVPVECVVRGYVSGSAWKEYQETGAVCEIELATGLKESDRLPAPIFTPATKAEQGQHDENITYDDLVARVGRDLAKHVSTRSIELYARGAEFAIERGIIIADTKFEFGMLDDELILIDEVLTPDSSRFWPADSYKPGGSPPSFDKQFVRDWLTQKSGWDKNSPPPPLPPEVVEKTRAKYIEAFERVTGEKFPWK